jgi:hypothetical protein
MRLSLEEAAAAVVVETALEMVGMHPSWEEAVAVEIALEMVGMHPSWEEAVAVEIALEMVGMVPCLLHRNHRTEH